MIHYNGKLSKRPGQQACRMLSPQAFSGTWHGTDCAMCKISLLGMPVVKVADSSAAATVFDLDENTVLVATSPGDDESEPDGERLSYEAFEREWRFGS